MTHSITTPTLLPLSQEMLATAEQLRSIRAALQRIVQSGRWPEGSFHDISTIIVDGQFVAKSLERLGSDTNSSIG